MSAFQPFAFMAGQTGGGGLPDVSTTGLRSWLDFGLTDSYPGTGTTVYDLSGNGFNGTINGAASYVATNGGGLQIYNTNTAGDPDPWQGVELPAGTLGGGYDFGFQLIGNYTSSAFNIPVMARFASVGGAFKAWGTTTQAAIEKLGGDQGFGVAIYNDGWSQGALQSYAFTGKTFATTGNWYLEAWRGNVSRYTNTADGGTGSWNTLSSGPRWGSDGSKGVAGTSYVLLCYNQILTQAQVEQNYNAYASRYGF